MNVDHYILNGFQKVATITRTKPEGVRKSKYGVYTIFSRDLKGASGVYLLTIGSEAKKIGESVNLDHRLMHYRIGSQPGNIYVRENINPEDTITVLFLECYMEEVSYGGVLTRKGISYRDLEKALLRQYLEVNGRLPEWNKGIQ